MNIVRKVILTIVGLIILPNYVSSGIFDFISGVVSSIPKKNVLSFEEINTQLTEIEGKLEEQTQTLQEQRQELKNYLEQVIDGKKETNQAQISLQKSKALPPRVWQPLKKSLTLQSEVLKQVEEILKNGQNLITQVIENRTPAVQRAISRVRAIAKKGKTTSRSSREPHPGEMISGILRNLF